MWHCFQLKCEKVDWIVISIETHYHLIVHLEYYHTSKGICFKMHFKMKTQNTVNSKHCKLQTLSQENSKHCLKSDPPLHWYFITSSKSCGDLHRPPWVCKNYSASPHFPLLWTEIFCCKSYWTSAQIVFAHLAESTVVPAEFEDLFCTVEIGDLFQEFFKLSMVLK